MKREKLSLYASYIGNGGSAVAVFLAVPFYLNYLGAEAYGLVATYAVLQQVSGVLSAIFAPVLTKELASLSSLDCAARKQKQFLGAIERLVLLAAILLILCLLGISPLMSDWINADELPKSDVDLSVKMMGVLAAIKLLEATYVAALLGLEAHLGLNLIRVLSAALIPAITVLAMELFGGEIQVFFVAQIISSLLVVFIFMQRVDSSLGRAGRFSPVSYSYLKRSARFSGGMLIITSLSLILMQADKAILLPALTLEEFGEYAIVATLAGALFRISAPISQVYFPRLSRLAEGKQKQEFSASFDRFCRITTAFVGCSGLILMLFAERVFQLWVGGEFLTQTLHLTSLFLISGYIINGISWPFYRTQLAFGDTAIGAISLAFAVILYLPILYFAVDALGIVGAGLAWLVVSIFQFTVGAYYTFKKYMANEFWPWLAHGLIRPLAPIATILLVAKLLEVRYFVADDSALFLVLVLVVGGITALFSARLVTVIDLKKKFDQLL